MGLQGWVRGVRGGWRTRGVEEEGGEGCLVQGVAEGKG